MVRLMFINAQVSLWRRAITLSKKFSPFAWKVLSWCSVISLIVSCIGVHAAKAPQVAHVRTIMPETYSADFEAKGEREPPIRLSPPSGTVAEVRRAVTPRDSSRLYVNSTVKLVKLEKAPPSDDFSKTRLVNDPPFSEMGADKRIKIMEGLSERLQARSTSALLAFNNANSLASFTPVPSEAALADFLVEPRNEEVGLKLRILNNYFEGRSLSFWQDEQPASGAISKGEEATTTFVAVPLELRLLFETDVVSANVQENFAVVKKRNMIRAIPAFRKKPATSKAATTVTDTLPSAYPDESASPTALAATVLRPANFTPSMHVMRSASNGIVQLAAPEDKSPYAPKLFLISLCGMIVSSFASITTLLLTWISLHRRRAEGMLMKLEIEKRQLEIEQLKINLSNAKCETSIAPALVVIPG